MSLKLSIIIPAYNEAPAIRAGKLKQVLDWLSGQPFAGEVILVDDGSQDETARFAAEAGSRVERIAHGGKAAAIAAGIRAAQGEIILFTDMDQATPITEAPRLLRYLETAPGVASVTTPGVASVATHDVRPGVAIGSRGLVRQGAPLGRYILSWSQVVLRSILIGLRLSDTQCGFKAFSRCVAQQVLDHLQVYNPDHPAVVQGPSVTSGFDVEFLFVAQRLGFPIYEVPVAWNYQQTRRVRLVRDAWRGITDLLRITVADKRGKYPR